MSENIPLDDNPPRLRLIEVPPEGLVLKFGDHHEEYIRSCPNCGHRMAVRQSPHMMPKWICPVGQAGKCSFVEEPVAKMTKALARDLLDYRVPFVCHKCKTNDSLNLEIHRRMQRVEVVVRHKQGHPCRAETYVIFHTIDSSQGVTQEFDEPAEKFEDQMEKLPEWTPEKVSKEMKERGHFEKQGPSA